MNTKLHISINSYI